MSQLPHAQMIDCFAKTPRAVISQPQWNSPPGGVWIDGDCRASQLDEAVRADQIVAHEPQSSRDLARISTVGSIEVSQPRGEAEVTIAPAKCRVQLGLARQHPGLEHLTTYLGPIHDVGGLRPPDELGAQIGM